MEYTCPCGKKHKSRNTVSRHKKAAAQKAVLADVPKDVLKDKKGQKKGQQEDKKGQEKGHSFLKEINLLGEFTKMADIVNQKKPEESKDSKYECGACHQKFNEKLKHCPHCGVEFE